MAKLAYLSVLETQIARISNRNQRIKEYILLAWEYLKLEKHLETSKILCFIIEEPEYLEGPLLKDLEKSLELRIAFSGLVNVYGVDLLGNELPVFD